MKIQNTQNPRDSKVAYSLPKSNNKARSKATKSGSDTGPVTLTLDPTRPDPTKIVDPVTRRPGSTTAPDP